MTTTRGPIAALERDHYLNRLDWHLEEQVPSAERRSILKDLRAEIDADPRPLPEVLDELGRPAVLAERYGEGRERRYPRWSAAALAAGGALGLYWVVFFSYVLGMLNAVGAMGGGEVEGSFLGIPVTAYDVDGAIGIGWTGTYGSLAGWLWLVIPAVVVGLTFGISSRIWRLWRTR